MRAESRKANWRARAVEQQGRTELLGTADAGDGGGCLLPQHAALISPDAPKKPGCFRCCCRGGGGGSVSAASALHAGCKIKWQQLRCWGTSIATTYCATHVPAPGTASFASYGHETSPCPCRQRLSGGGSRCVAVHRNRSISSLRVSSPLEPLV